MSMKNIYETEFQKIISDEKEYLEKMDLIIWINLKKIFWITKKISEGDFYGMEILHFSVAFRYNDLRVRAVLESQSVGQKLIEELTQEIICLKTKIESLQKQPSKSSEKYN